MARVVKKPQERRAEIVHAALKLFKTQGYEKTTMQDVMNDLAIAKGTIYHYFKSKEELLEAVVGEIVDLNFVEMAEALENARGNALKKFKLLIKKGNISGENQDLLEQLHRKNNQAMHCRLLAETITKQATLYAKVIEQGCEEKLFKTDKPLECAEFFLSGIQFLTDEGFYPWSDEEIARRLKAFPKLMERL
jgi:AcrR family transcriptional regulator